MNVLAIGAHPDDIEILCAGTLALYAQARHNVTMAVFTDGSMGDLKIPPAKLAKIRHGEQQAAADIIGARLLWPAITDEHVFPNEAQRRVMIDLLRQLIAKQEAALIVLDGKDKDHRLVRNLKAESARDRFRLQAVSNGESLDVLAVPELD